MPTWTFTLDLLASAAIWRPSIAVWERGSQHRRACRVTHAVIAPAIAFQWEGVAYDQRIDAAASFEHASEISVALRIARRGAWPARWHLERDLSTSQHATNATVLGLRIQSLPDCYAGLAKVRMIATLIRSAGPTFWARWLRRPVKQPTLRQRRNREARARLKWFPRLCPQCVVRRGDLPMGRTRRTAMSSKERPSDHYSRTEQNRRGRTTPHM